MPLTWTKQLLRLFVHVKDQRLTIREAGTSDEFKNSIQWDNLEFIYSDNADLMVLWTCLLPELTPANARALIKLAGDRCPVSPHYKKLKRLCPPLIISEETKEWVFFGGSFNPWHEGHQAALNLLPEDKTCFVLPDINPYRPLRDFDLTVTVLELSSKIHFKKNQFLIPAFLVENIKNPTVDWMERLKKDFPHQKLSLLMGFDSFAALTQWTRYQDLLPLLYRIYVVSRLETDQTREEERKKLKGPEVIFLGRHEFEDVSSTKLRKK